MNSTHVTCGLTTHSRHTIIGLDINQLFFFSLLVSYSLFLFFFSAFAFSGFEASTSLAFGWFLFPTSPFNSMMITTSNLGVRLRETGGLPARTGFLVFLDWRVFGGRVCFFLWGVSWPANLAFAESQHWRLFSGQGEPGSASFFPTSPHCTASSPLLFHTLRQAHQPGPRTLFVIADGTIMRLSRNQFVTGSPFPVRRGSPFRLPDSVVELSSFWKSGSKMMDEKVI
ncbi:hypothetical protein B0T13DRAFT_1454 [Neurospora crassa]|nr:hypothetical protein B0T13DRAFT_160699 [Neurospora crassa]KAK3504257.1 hypothetical protein B0T13DRAFT_1454 [Neurospora crassa]